MGPELGSFYKVEEKHIAALDKIYQRIQKSNQRILQIAQRDTKTYIDSAVAEYQRKMKEEKEKADKLPRLSGEQKSED